MGPSPEERDAAFHKQVNERAKAVDKLLQQKQYEAALQESLTKPPIGCKVQSTKDKNLKTVLAVISSAPSDEAKIRAMIEKMHNSSGDLCTTLMKYIYRGLAEGQYSGTLFKWHALTAAIAGNGTIVRAMTDRKTV